MTTLAEFMILSGGDNRPPMLDKDLTKKYEELFATKKIQADCELKETNIIFQGLPFDVYSLGRQSSFAAGTYGTRANISGTGENNSGQQRVVKCFNCQREGHMARQCPKLKRKRDATWFRDKVLLVEAQGSGKVLNEEELAFLADLGVAEAKAVLMANLSLLRIRCSLREKNAQFEDFEKENNYLKQTLSEQLKEKELLTKTLNVLKNESKEKEAKNIDKEIALEKKVIELDNIVYFGKRFVPQQELSDEKAIWLQTSHTNTDQSASSPVKIEAPRELPKCNKCLELEVELIKQHNMVEKDEYNRLLKSFSKLAMQLNKEIFQKNNTFVNQTEPTFDHLFELNNLKAELQAKDTTIEKLKANIKRLNKTSTTNSVKKDIDEIENINIVLEHRVAKLVAENEHLKQTYKQLYDSIKPSRVRAKEHVESLVNQLNQNASYSACKYVKPIQELLGYVRDTCPDIHKPGVSQSTKSSRSKSKDNTKNDRILQILSSTQKKNKVEDHSRIVKSRNANVLHSKLNTNSKLMCIKCNSSMFDARHELCFLEFISSMNASSKSKSVKKTKKKEEWKPTGKVFTKIGYNSRHTRRTFTLVRNACPLTRITTTNKVPLMEPIPLEVVA
ncbi:retrovirus-related pol polyprotein from transposon TNT 1-94 [Tanacetum coccineum]